MVIYDRAARASQRARPGRMFRDPDDRMKRLTASASATITAPPERAVATLEAVDRYPEWHADVVRDVVVIERNAAGAPTLARAVLELALGPASRTVELTLSVTARPNEVTLTRVPNAPSDHEELELAWQVEPGRLLLRIGASLDVPRLLPVGSIAAQLAEGFVGAASSAIDAR